MPLLVLRRKQEARSAPDSWLLIAVHSSTAFIRISMSLRDLACYTLTLQPHASDPNVTELVTVENGREEHRFARVREQREGEAYSSAIYGKSFRLRSWVHVAIGRHAK